MYPGSQGNGNINNNHPPTFSNQQQWMEYLDGSHGPVSQHGQHQQQAGPAGAGSLSQTGQPSPLGFYPPGSSPSSSSHSQQQQHHPQMTHHHPSSQQHHHSQSHINQYYPYPVSSPGQQQQQQRTNYQQLQHQQQQQQIQQLNSGPHNNNNNSNNYSVRSPYSFSAMQSPPPSTMIGSPGQPYSNSSVHSNPSPTRSMSSPLSFPMGSPLMRQFSGPHQGPSSVQGPPTTPSPHPMPPSPSPSQTSTYSQVAPPTLPAPSAAPTPSVAPIPSVAPVLSVAPTPYVAPAPTVPPAPSAPSAPPPAKKAITVPPKPTPTPSTSKAAVGNKTVLTNGKSNTAPYALHSESVVEEPLPQYPSPDEIERMALQARPMIPEVMLNRILAKAGLAFQDPKIGMLISLAAQNFVNDVVKEAVVVQAQMNGQTGRGQERQLTRRSLEKVLQDRGMKQLPADPFLSGRPPQ